MTKNTVQRLLVFFLGVPLFILFELYASFGRNILLVIVAMGIQLGALYETTGLFYKKGIKLNRAYLAALALLSSALVYLSPLYGSLLPSAKSPLELLLIISLLGSLAAIAPFAFSKKEELDSLLPRIAASLFSYFYCGILGACLVYIGSCFQQYSSPLFIFLLMTSGNDSMAWLVGVSVGRKRGIVAVSPNKSLAGFLGGLSGSLLAGLISYYLFPNAGIASLISLLFVGLCVGVTVILGDLLESALKRSAGVKDSSSFIPGRGGILDSFDSLFFSAPLFIALASIWGFFSSPV
ncbi:MAG: phosphatidate cytidylyltransferase [Spirochaetia bacterium]|jgi:phosphatidate cytidylyltransferase|nr:phosphatidate cytidylyltransferase [Spirochaetia bacterium]